MKNKKWILIYMMCSMLLTGCASGETLAEMAATQEYERVGATEAPSPTPEPTPKVVTFTVSAVGDVTLGNAHIQGYEGTFNEMYDIQNNPAYFFENSRPRFMGRMQKELLIN